MTTRYLSLVDERTIEADVSTLIFDLTIPRNEMWAVKAVIINGEEDSEAPVYGQVVMKTRDSPIEFIVDNFSWTGRNVQRAAGFMIYGSEDRIKLSYSSSESIALKTLIVILVETNVESLPYVPPALV